MKSKVTSNPAVEPVSLAEVKTSLRITDTADDAFISQLIEDARVWCENYTGRKFITQEITSYLDGFRGSIGSGWWSGVRTGARATVYGEEWTYLEFGPAQSITSVATIGTDNQETAYSNTNYYLDNFDNDMRPRMVLNVGSTITATDLRPSNSVKVVYVAGYGDAASNVPAALRRAIILMTSKLYETRGDCESDACAESCGANKLIEQYRMIGIDGVA